MLWQTCLRIEEKWKLVKRKTSMVRQTCLRIGKSGKLVKNERADTLADLPKN